MGTAQLRLQDRRWQLLCLALAILTLYRAAVASRLPLYLDEAQYWTWSLHPAWGYYSKPPMVAWLIALSTLASQGELAIRLGTLLLHPLSALLIAATGWRIGGRGTGLLAGLLFASLPLVGFNSLFMTTDAPLVLCWAAAVASLWRALQTNAWRHWLMLGAAAGAGLLSKYSMALLLPSIALVFALPAWRAQWRNPRPWLAALLALLIFLPNLLWNAQADFVSLRHTADISQLDRALFHPARLAEFVGAQFLCMGPLAFAALLAALLSPSTWRDPALGFLAAMTLPFLALIGLQALLARANANWAAPAYVGGSLLVAARWRMAARPRLRLACAAILSNLVFLSVFYHYQELARLAGIELTRRGDPYARLLGWPQAGAAVRQALARHPGALLATVTREEFALLSYYTGVQPDRVRIWNPQQQRSNHYHLVADAARNPGATYLFATRTPLGPATASAFAHWRALGSASVPLYRDGALTLYLYCGRHFQGYRP